MFFLTFSLFVGVLVTGGRTSQIGCLTKTRSVATLDTDHFCPWQGAFVIAFSLGGAIWWMISAVDLFIILVIGVKLNKAQVRIKTIVYFTFAVGFPILMPIIVAAQHAIGNNTSLGWCFFNNHVNAATEFGTFWVPLIVFLIVGGFCILALFRTLYISSKITGNAKKAGAWKQYVRPMLFFSEFLFVFAFVVSYKFNSRINADLYTGSIVDLITCLLGPGGSESTCGSHAKVRPSVGLWRLIHFGLSAQGLLNWVVYGTVRNNYELWYNFCCGGLGFSQALSKGDGDSSLGSAHHRHHTNAERGAAGLEMKSTRTVSSPSSKPSSRGTSRKNSSTDLGGSSRQLNSATDSAAPAISSPVSRVSAAALRPAPAAIAAMQAQGPTTENRGNETCIHELLVAGFPVLTHVVSLIIIFSGGIAHRQRMSVIAANHAAPRAESLEPRKSMPGEVQLEDVALTTQLPPSPSIGHRPTSADRPVSLEAVEITAAEDTE